MEVVQAIRTRRSMGKLTDHRPPRELVERLIEAACWAPNHFMTQPWRFWVLTGRAREALGEAMARGLSARLQAQGKAPTPEQLEGERTRPLRAPVVIVVAVEPKIEDPRVVEVEEIAAGAAAVQNLLLAAHGSGLAAYWRTGSAAYDPVVKAHLGLSERAHILGFVYLGYPDGELPPPKPRDPASRTVWQGWE
ncbi:nitroreductase family protein [Geochorda subterranea]|uniref:Putative NAD(P)H nitroreductase n=1 Tax=Geochorda subterranea TaxID=3109564 RepID=A0ABZ1BPC4_9FIRM|nr:nitroreductase [Limnochorda sp. LNt]WRP13957.1 nitroreductase [Limnochorda sp. LNt]